MQAATHHTGLLYLNTHPPTNRWTIECGDYARGDPRMHLIAARTSAAAKDYAPATSFYVHCQQPKEYKRVQCMALWLFFAAHGVRLRFHSSFARYAEQLFKWSNFGYRRERDLFLARAVFQ